MSLTWETPVTDRTTNDVYVVQSLSQLSWDEMTSVQKARWQIALKGALNTSDLRRIENNIHLLSEVIELGLTTYEDDIPYIPTLPYWQNMINNVQKIREREYAYYNTPKTPSLPINYFSKVNDIEKILRDTYEIIVTNLYYESIDSWYMGEEIGLVL